MKDQIGRHEEGGLRKSGYVTIQSAVRLDD
jgi:hypothetical protein